MKENIKEFLTKLEGRTLVNKNKIFIKFLRAARHKGFKRGTEKRFDPFADYLVLHLDDGKPIIGDSTDWDKGSLSVVQGMNIRQLLEYYKKGLLEKASDDHKRRAFKTIFSNRFRDLTEGHF